MRALRVFICDVRYQIKYGFYFLYTVIAAVYICILLFLPASVLRPAAALIILTDPAALGFFFVGGMVLLERGEGLHAYYSILPVPVSEYIFAKTMSLSLISTLVGMLIAGFALGSQVNYILLFFGLFLGASVFTMLGLVVGTVARSVNHYFVIGVPVGVLLMLPAFITYLDIYHFSIEILPATLLLRVLNGALGLPLPHHPLFSLAGLLLWFIPAFALANSYFAKYIRKVGG